MSGSYNVKLRVLAAFRFLFVPLVRILIRSGVSANELNEVIKGTYARVAATDLVDPNRPMSYSRISIATGLTRKDIQRAFAEEEKLRRALESNAARLANVLQGWHNDPEFQGPYGFPRDLDFERQAGGGSSFSELIGRYSPDITPDLMLGELLRVRSAVIAPESGMIRVQERTYIPGEMAPEAVEVFARGVRRYVETIDHNLRAKNSADRRFERWVFPDHGIRSEDWDTFRELVRVRLEKVIEELERQFGMLKQPDESSDKVLTVGVGLYLYKDDLSDDKRFEQMLTRLLAQAAREETDRD